MTVPKYMGMPWGRIQSRAIFGFTLKLVKVKQNRAAFRDQDFIGHENKKAAENFCSFAR